MSQPTRFEVQTCFGDTWENCWSETDENNVETAQTFETHDDAQAAIYEFFADLHRAGMAQLYLLEDYRVMPVAVGAVNE